MKASSPIQRRHLLGVAWLLVALWHQMLVAAPLTLYSTQFNPAQGFVVDQSVAGRDGWISEGAGGNGIVTNFIENFGQSAYIGFAPAPANGGHYLYRPVNFTPTNRPLVTFTVDWVLFDSTTTNRDEFRWSVYNTLGQRLFTLLFDNRDLGIYYQLDDGDDFQSTDWGFENDVAYTLEMQMNFASNRWNAWLNGTQIVTNQPITTINAARTLGDMDAVWLPGVPGKSGDNFLVFDNYTLTADLLPPPPAATPAIVQLLGAVSGQQLIRVSGQTNANYALEGTTNLLNWSVLKTNAATGGFYDYLDTGSIGLKQRFYRARWVP